jgi:hypothetical protein
VNVEANAEVHHHQDQHGQSICLVVVIELTSDFVVKMWGCAVLLEDETGTQKALLSSMAAIFSHIAPGGDQCYYVAAQYTNINFQSFSFHRYQFCSSEFH